MNDASEECARDSLSMPTTDESAAEMKSRPTRQLMGRLVYAASGVSLLSIIGQLTVVASIPLLTRLYSPSDFGVFTIYLGIVNILAAAAALRLNVSLYVVGEQAYAAFKLVIVTIASTSMLTAGAGVLLASSAPERLLALVYLVPIGMATTGIVDALNCWSLSRGRLRDFAIGRLVAPVFMALSQVGFGFLQWGGDSMVLAHILSQLVLIGFLSIRVFTWNEVCRVTRVPWKDLMAVARGEYKFPLFDLPGTILNFGIINLPAILIGSLFGTSMAGHFGVAARLFSSPISLVALPLSNVFVSEATKGNERCKSEHSYKSGVFLVLLAGALITLPALAIGAAAPYFVGPLLGPDWISTGNLMTALALTGAAQALSTPVQEVPSLLRRQGLGLIIDSVRALLVFAPILLGVYGKWDPLHIIYAMSAGGAIGYLLRTAVSLLLLRGASNRNGVAAPKPVHHLGLIRTETGEVA
ncbi:lipopolysaccharide biosynthesis protein [Bradyrhizobium japonicum]|uniref:lipopolysaccharide biosynthesis protein n=2 Tax=Bradyrhizobium japonicum TaxID=375 RepID=UPI000B0204DC|nr:lipopolysaccharide biosynthesis protein [Bradyrhizobium japonicum]MCD9105898.1 lipopolysaccharide biosynthesis protein [Bradyrhizobium japonicum]MCD9253457.1 lipopolysaccharide biosynthesis protein [Bradyrhizobium japonicum SEMIA 5079]MCD9818542.1 lipopolysaccharide biosynthesis protein [Bradyrhizobium japonicum]MCD9891523.1 lipopolysaccharide biosynthesis protein [Bradyrhizobium japonicum]MCD9907220.1 lipopolysaccharide biosynthesis protein [Bradyrhizobium japonicum]